MGLFDKVKEFKKMISDVEKNIYAGKTDYLEVYERNLQLEKEIEARTSELNIANKRIVTLQHIWDMMNSAKPLDNVLDTIVNIIQGEFGYLHCTILRKSHDENGDYMNVLAQSGDKVIERVDKIIKVPMQTRRLTYNPDSIYAQALNEKRIIQTTDLKKALEYIIPDLTDQTVEEFLKGMVSKSLITIPLYKMNKEFGWFCVFSSRNDLAESETDFLTMFAQQIEMAITIADLFQAVKEQAVTDGLTGLYNRRYFEEFMAKEVTRSLRQHQPFTIIGLDLDFLKQINDKYGHAYGDIAIKTVADVLKKNARSIDIAARMGGEEFNIILPGIDSKGGMIAAERIRKAIESQQLDVIGHVTASIGVATFLEHSDKIEELMELTDQAMYQSKRNGRNQVTLAIPISEISWQEIAVNTFLEILSKRKIPLAKQISEELCSKLQGVDPQKDMPIEMLYSVGDMLTSLYNPMHAQGTVKQKVLLAVSLAKRFDLPKNEIDNLRIAVLLYDIGNLLLPFELLQKTAPLTAEEKEHIKSHPVIAAQEILKPISYVKDVIPIIEHHHENWDGTGYPGKISKEAIPLTSQIILIVDAYFALTEFRPYRSKLTPTEALEEIKKDTGKKWNSTLVDEFVTIIEHDVKNTL